MTEGTTRRFRWRNMRRTQACFFPLMKRIHSKVPLILSPGSELPLLVSTRPPCWPRSPFSDSSGLRALGNFHRHGTSACHFAPAMLKNPSRSRFPQESGGTSINLQKSSRTIRRGGRVVDRAGLENRRRETVRGFESHPLRHPLITNRLCVFMRIHGVFWVSGFLVFRMLIHHARSKSWKSVGNRTIFCRGLGV